MSLVVEVQNLKKSFGKRGVLADVSFCVARGESYVIIGGSGSGKSVLFKCILKLFSIDQGTIRINGQDINKASTKRMSEILMKCGVLYQGGALFDSFNVIENVSFGLVHCRGMSTKSSYAIAIEKLESVDLDERVALCLPSELSGGMRKRVALARALAMNPDIIFFDEPTTGLDPITSSLINDLIVKCTKEMKISAISITHDINSLRRISDRVGLLYKGSVIWEGMNSDLMTTDNPYIRQFMEGSSIGPFTDGQR
jgi:phospholipid/cholesterol/gamma-HCH transport system ATP-binding protein